MMSREQMKQILLDVAGECSQRGPGYAQEGVVLREAKDRIRPHSLEEEQLVLDCWHELFREGKVVWGYNLDNPGAPFFHSGSVSAS